jgi:CheY-like chemotaxis protein
MERNPRDRVCRTLTRRKALVLIVEDHADLRDLVALALQEAGFRTACAANGAEAVELAPSITPDLILMDACMPVMNGFEAIRHLRRDEQTRDVPIVMLTAAAGRATKEDAMMAGCTSFLAKPMDPEDLIDHLRVVLAARSLAEEPTSVSG